LYVPYPHRHRPKGACRSCCYASIVTYTFHALLAFYVPSRPVVFVVGLAGGFGSMLLLLTSGACSAVMFATLGHVPVALFLGVQWLLRTSRFAAFIYRIVVAGIST
jgi:hypothetical protein